MITEYYRTYQAAKLGQAKYRAMGYICSIQPYHFNEHSYFKTVAYLI